MERLKYNNVYLYDFKEYKGEIFIKKDDDHYLGYSCYADSNYIYKLYICSIPINYVVIK